MKRLLFLMAILVISHYGHALAITANDGLYEAETAPEFAYSGTGWVQVVDGDYIVMESSAIDDEVTFEFEGSSIIIFRELLPVADTPATVEICLDGECVLVTNEASENQKRVPIAYFAGSPGVHSLSMSNQDGGIFRFDYVIVMPENDLSATSSPSPSMYFFTLQSGQVVAVDFSISGGEIAQIIFLAFLSALLALGIVIQRTSNE